MQTEIQEIVKLLGLTELQAYRHVRDRREILRYGKLPAPRYWQR
jgi:hypothetical protein